MESITATGLLSGREPQPKDVQSQTMGSGNPDENTQESIANLAYALWQNRGCPIGSSEQDWIDAEKQLRRPKTKVGTAAGGR